MDRTLISVLDTLAEKVRLLSRQKEELSAENLRLSEQLEKMRKELEESASVNFRLQQDIDYLTLSHRLADTPDSVVKSRKKISALIRKIDRCISLLKDDAEL